MSAACATKVTVPGVAMPDKDVAPVAWRAMPMRKTKDICCTWMKAGKYWIGDPCWATKDWKDVHLSDDDSCGIMQHPTLGSFVWASTGEDGWISSHSDTVYTVDASMLGVVPVGLLADPAVRGGRMITFEHGMIMTYDPVSMVFTWVDAPSIEAHGTMVEYIGA